MVLVFTSMRLDCEISFIFYFHRLAGDITGAPTQGQAHKPAMRRSYESTHQEHLDPKLRVRTTIGFHLRQGYDATGGFTQLTQ